MKERIRVGLVTEAQDRDDVLQRHSDKPDLIVRGRTQVRLIGLGRVISIFPLGYACVFLPWRSMFYNRRGS